MLKKDTKAPINKTSPSASIRKRNAFTIMVIGFADGLTWAFDIAYNFIYKDDYGLSPANATYIDTLKTTPWMIKPLWGILSDNVLFLGYRRKSYILLNGIIGMLTFFLIGTVDLALFLMITLMFLNQVACSFENCMGEALVVESTIDKNKDTSLSE